MARASKFAPGIIVKLKSGGPEMTIRRFLSDAETSVNCQWFAGKKLEDGNFPVESLELVTPAPKGD